MSARNWRTSSFFLFTHGANTSPSARAISSRVSLGSSPATSTQMDSVLFAPVSIAVRRTTQMALHAYIVVSLLTGARTEELRALTWSHVDLNASSPNHHRRVWPVYLLHFSQPYQHARHYTGWTEDLLVLSQDSPPSSLLRRVVNLRAHHLRLRTGPGDAATLIGGGDSPHKSGVKGRLAASV